MKTMFKAALAATVATGLFASPAFAANTAAAPFVAKATIVKPLTIVKNFDLDFGTITMGPSLNTQTVSVNQDNTTACGGTDLTCSFPTQAAATFTVTGVGTQTLLVDLGTPPTALKDAALHTVDSPSTPPRRLLSPMALARSASAETLSSFGHVRRRLQCQPQRDRQLPVIIDPRLLEGVAGFGGPFFVSAFDMKLMPR